MNLSMFLEDEPLNEHEVAWRSKDWAAVKELAKSFKKPADQSLFEIVSIVTKKTGHRSVEEFDDYNQYAINHAIGQHVELSGYASELNAMEGFISDQMHFDYLYFAVRQTSLPRIKFAKISEDWEHKALISWMSDYFEVSESRAAEYFKRFNETQINHLKKMFSPTVTSSDSPVLAGIPTKTERERVFRSIRSW